MATTAPMHKNRNTTMGRINTILATGGIFKDVSLANKVYSDITPVTKLSHWELPGGSGSWMNWKFEDIIQQDFQETTIGNGYGPTWHTHWFKVEITVPDHFTGEEVHLRWNSQTEACVYDPIGNLLGSLAEYFREDFVISKSWTPSTGPLTYYIEMTCNGITGIGQNGDGIAPTDNNKYFFLWTCEFAIFNRDIYKLVTDIDMLRGMANELSSDHRGYQAMFCANEMINLIRKNDFEKPSQIADAFFAEGTGAKSHTIVALGHCHIDTAWLWPYDETKRKCARSWVAQIRLMRDYPEFVFVCSQAQQFAWVKEYYPKLFDELKVFIAEGRFQPVGGTWVEMDGNLPSGEAFIRQFYYGQNFFRDEFGILCKEYWLPDTFGYSAQIPQIMKHVGVSRFVTIKMFWNIVNRFPTQNFWWEGLDGTQVISHFPPTGNPNMTGAVNEILQTVNNSDDKGRSSQAMYLFGVGDGGGGPTRQMLERQNRLKNVDGMPNIVFGRTDTFFELLEKEAGKLSKWVGELFLERHNGTYTSQARIKWYNRKIEFFFREVEHLIAQARVNGKIDQAGLDADQIILDVNWKKFLLNQFHDVLPGSCVQIVREDAWRLYGEVFVDLTALSAKYSALLLVPTGTTRPAIFNPLSWDVQMVVFNRADSGQIPTLPGMQSVTLDADGADFEDATEGHYKVPNSFGAALVQLKAGGFSLVEPIEPTQNAVVFSQNGTTAQLSNGLIRVQVDNSGAVPIEQIFFTGPKSRIESPVFGDRLGTGILGGMFYIYDDIPDEWDAWDVMDYHLETQRLPDFIELEGFTGIAQGPVVGAYKMTAKFGSAGSSITRYTILRANSPMVEYYTEIDWKETHKLLKVEFPLDILAREATYEVQFGHLKRPTHINTSWEMAKYEVVGHKWVDMSQGDKGVTVITDSKYGWHARDNIVKLSLLRSPKNPDAECDMHKHFVHYAVLPHEGTFQKADVIRRAYELNYLSANNVPFWNTSLTSTQLPLSLLTIDEAAVVVSAIKMVPGSANTMVVRLYESHGGKSSAKISLGFDVKTVKECNGLEAPITGENLPVNQNSFEATFTPFQIRSFLVDF